MWELRVDFTEILSAALGLSDSEAAVGFGFIAGLRSNASSKPSRRIAGDSLVSGHASIFNILNVERVIIMCRQLQTLYLWADI